ncbi:hypothetical protein PG993_012633 [Apiospora rasikravindrae]|uniref:Uncharacterized protein n=1 Tax=Apiospora rasikravindrae TaxID=990691 RepID=A0ABR1S2X5_9PEZI
MILPTPALRPSHLLRRRRRRRRRTRSRLQHDNARVSGSTTGPAATPLRVVVIVMSGTTTTHPILPPRDGALDPRDDPDPQRDDLVAPRARPAVGAGVDAAGPGADAAPVEVAEGAAGREGGEEAG